MITIGLDPHPDSHTVAALDENGSMLASMTVPNTYDGQAQLHRFALPFSERRWAIEGAANRFILCFVNELLAQGEVVHHIPPNLTSQYRARLSRKKNDIVDARTPLKHFWPTPHYRRFVQANASANFKILAVPKDGFLNNSKLTGWRCRRWTRTLLSAPR